MQALRLTTVMICAALLATAPALAGEIEIYINGSPCRFEVPDDLEMYELEPVYILEDNRALLQEFCIECPQYAQIGAGNNAWDRSLDRTDEFYGEREIQPFIRDIRYRDYLSSEDWQSIWGNVNGTSRVRLDLDHSGPLWSFDGRYMRHEGVSAGPDGLSEEEVLLTGLKERSQFDFTLRSGGMDGGTQFLNGQWYKVDADEMPFQVVDVEHMRLGAGFRMVECPGMLQAEVFAGFYESDRQNMDNDYMGARADGYLALGERATLSGYLSTTEIDAKLQNGSATRTDTDAGLSYELSEDLELGFNVRGYSDDSDITSVTDARSYTERAASLQYHPSSRADVSLSLARREVDYQRIQWENLDLYQLDLRDPAIGRAELAAFRVDEEADYDSLQLRSNFRLDSCSRLSADFRRDDYGSLPDSGDTGSLSLQPSYLANERQWSSLFFERRMRDGGSWQLTASENSRDNDVRDSRYCARRYAVSYGRPLWDCYRWTASVSRSETDLEGNGIDVIWDSETTSYGLDLSGYGNWAQYRLSLGHHIREGAATGDYSSLGLELDFNDSPMVLNSWWREQQAGNSPLAYSEDIGLALGWQVRF